jgi:hypothetical protein
MGKLFIPRSLGGLDKEEGGKGGERRERKERRKGRRGVWETPLLRAFGGRFSLGRCVGVL